MADSEAQVTTPKKSNRPPKKKNKNDLTKNNTQKNTTNSSGPSPGAGRGFVKNKDVSVKPNTNKEKAKEGSGNATPEKKNTGRPFQRNYQGEKKKNNYSSKNFNSTKMENQPKGPSKPYPPKGDDNKEIESSRDERENREDKNSLDYERRQMIEAERRRKWHEHFMSNPNDLIIMDRNKVILLKMVEKSRPQAQLYCRLCNYYCDNMSVVLSHVKKPLHLQNLKDYNDEMTVRDMPEMTREQMGVLEEFLMSLSSEIIMGPEYIEIRRTIGALVSELVSSNLPGCKTRLFGSSIHGLGLKSSDVNIDLQVPEGTSPPAMLKKVASVLRTSPHFDNVIENFHCEFPFISFIYKISGENCSLSLNNERAVNLALLLSKYTLLDPRLPLLASLFRYWGQLTQTDKAQDGTWPGYAFYILTIFYLQQCNDPVLPVLNDFLPNNCESESNGATQVLSLDVNKIRKQWITGNEQNLASLWIGLLRFYAIEFDYTGFMVCIDSSSLKPRKTNKIFIVDPFLPTRNVARSISSNETFYYIIGCLMMSCRYFSLPQPKSGPLFKGIYTSVISYSQEQKVLLDNHERINSLLVDILMRLDSFFYQQRGDVHQYIQEVMLLMHNHNFRNIDNIPVAYLDLNLPPPRFEYREMSVSAKDAQLLVSSFSAEHCQYHFTPNNLTGGESVPKICEVCKNEGHLKDDCPEEVLPPLEPLPELSVEGIQLLDSLCQHIHDKWKQSDEDIQKREKICRGLQKFIEEVHPTVKLELFGSTKNGFGLKGSDMDICLTFEDNKTGEGLDTRNFIDVLYRVLCTFKELQNLLPIPTAKVPIVKFTHKTARLDGDISLYNVLALENSKLLHTYSQIDVRVQILGHMMKRFSKVCNIGDASKGSLSSYAYTLLVIYFLQRCDPPVLPVLQELTEDGSPPPKHLVEGCNAYFFSDLSKLVQ